jgi:hypothetical protein
MNKHEKILWQKMADLTMSRCQKKCKTKLGSCCNGNESYCEMAIDTMRKSGAKPPKKARGKDGKCLIPPWYRPLCTLHQCDINNIGCAPDDLKWTEEYFDLRGEIEQVGFDEATGL